MKSLPKMCWFEESVVAEAPRPAPRPMRPTPPLPVSPPLVPTAAPAPAPTEAKEIQTLVESEPVLEEKEIQTATASDSEESNPPQPVEEEQVANLEHYSIHTEEGECLSFTSYVNSSGVRMVEINADSGIQIKLSTLEHCVKTMTDSAARVDETEVLEQERQQEFDGCAEITISATFVLLISLVVSIYIYMVSRGVSVIG